MGGIAKKPCEHEVRVEHPAIVQAAQPHDGIVAGRLSHADVDGQVMLAAGGGDVIPGIPVEPDVAVVVPAPSASESEKWPADGTIDTFFLDDYTEFKPNYYH